MQLATVKICLPLPKLRPAGCDHLFDGRGQVGKCPFRPRPAVLQQRVARHDLRRRDVFLGIRQIGVEVVDDVQGSVHPPPVAGIRADKRIDSRRGRSDQAQLCRVPRLQQVARQQDLRRAGHVVPRGKARLLRVGLGEQADLLERPRLDDHEVVRHQVVVLQHEFDRFSRLDGDDILVVRHPLEDGAELDHAHAQLAELRPHGLGLAGGQEGRERIAELARIEGCRTRPPADGRLDESAR